MKKLDIYQDLKAEAEAKVAKRLAQKGVSIEEITNLVDFSIEEVQRILQQAESSDS